MNPVRNQLLSIFAGEEPDYRRAAELGPVALPVLRELVDEGDPIAGSAVHVAALIATHDALPILAGAAGSDDTGLRVHAAGSLCEFLRRTRSATDREAAWELFAPLLEDRSPGVRRFAERRAAELPEYAMVGVRSRGR
jgi:hypothetical protein